MNQNKSNISHERFTEIVNLSHEAIIALDESREIILFNPAAQKLFGYDEREIIGQSLDQLLPMNARHNHGDYMNDFDHSEVQSRTMSERSVIRGLTKANNAIELYISIQKHPDGSPIKYSAICSNAPRRH